MKPSEIREAVTEDLTTVPRDILEFNYAQLARSAAEWVDMVERQHAAEMAALRNRIGVGAFAISDLVKMRRQGRKTVRIQDVIDAAELNYQKLGKPQETGVLA